MQSGKTGEGKKRRPKTLFPTPCPFFTPWGHQLNSFFCLLLHVPDQRVFFLYPNRKVTFFSKIVNSTFVSLALFNLLHFPAELFHMYE